MRKLTVLFVAILMTLAFTVQAQDENEFIFSDLDEEFTVQDLGLTFSYPSDWTWNADSGILVAENESDIEAQNDDDDTTNIDGTIITMNAFPVDSFGLEDPTLDSLAEFLVEFIEIEVSEIVEVPVMARRAITFIGGDETASGVATMWVQNDLLVFFSMRSADRVIDSDFGFTWGIILSTVTPITELELTETLELPDFGVSVDYPEGWTPVITEDGLTIYELEEEAAVQAEFSEGLTFILTILETPFETFGLPEEPNTDDLIILLDQLLIVAGDVTPVATEEYVIVGFEGASVIGISEDREFVQGAFLVSTSDSRLMLTGMTAGDMDTLIANDALLTAMLQSITELE